MKIGELAVVVVLLLTLCVLTALPSQAQDEKERTDECCKQELEKIKIASAIDEVRYFKIIVTVDRSPNGKKTLNAWASGCERAYLTCEITITEKLLKTFPKDELMATLAHEFGHLANPYAVSGLEDQCEADAFALLILKRLGIDRRALLRVIDRASKNALITTPEGTVITKERIRRIKLALGNKNKAIRPR